MSLLSLHIYSHTHTVENTMQITINGKPEELQADTIMDVLKQKDIDPHMVAVELNTQIVERDRLESTNVQDGDKVEFLFYMGGGA